MDIERRIEIAKADLEAKVIAQIPEVAVCAMDGLDVFERFYESFKYDNRTFKMMEQKLLHTFEVTNRCLQIAEDSDKETQEAAFWVGLLHDFGRVVDFFSGTFKGLGHPDAGGDLLFKYGLINMFSLRTVDLQMLERGIRLHGVLSVEATCLERGWELTETEKEIVSIIRTADKWDIFSFLLYIPLETTVGVGKERIASEDVSDRSFEELTNGKPIDRAAEMYTNNRHWLSHVGFVYDVEETAAGEKLLQWLEKTEWLDAYMDPVIELASSENRAKLEKIKICAKAYISERLDK